MKDITMKHSNGEVTVIWRPSLCQHAGNCVRGLPGVFDFKRKPWIDAKQATTAEIVEQVKKCPSGALSFLMNHEGA
jgi:uncharacterized Fe-S cluster protein YjdI